MKNLIDLTLTVFPSEEPTIQVAEDQDYGGAHEYVIRKCRGFNDGKTEYVEDTQFIQFVKKENDGTIVPGVQSEQLLLMMIDRHKKLNARFPSEYNEKMIAGMEMAVEAMEERVKDRMDRKVMGDLKN